MGEQEPVRLLIYPMYLLTEPSYVNRSTLTKPCSQGVLICTAYAFPPPAPATADATTTSATPETVACSAFTTRVPSERICCSLITTWPPGKGTVWFTVPSIRTSTPLIERLEMYEVASPGLPSKGPRAAASAEAAAMAIPAMVRLSEER